MFNQIINILFPVFTLALIGFCIGRWIKPDFRPINRINMEAFIPALVFSSLVTMPLDIEQIPLISASFIAVLIPAFLMLFICRLFKLSYRVWAPPQMFRNSGNLAIPIFTYAFGNAALAPAVLLFVASTCLHISLGLALASKETPIKQMSRSLILLAAIFALTLNLTGIGIWAPINNATTLLGQAAIPIMLVSLGAQMCNIRLTGLKIGMSCTLLSLCTGAISFTAIYLFVPLSNIHLQMMLLFTMLPPAVLNYVFAERFNLEPEKIASMILFSNFFCIVTLPILLTFTFFLD